MPIKKHYLIFLLINTLLLSSPTYALDYTDAISNLKRKLRVYIHEDDFKKVGDKLKEPVVINSWLEETEKCVISMTQKELIPPYKRGQYQIQYARYVLDFNNLKAIKNNNSTKKLEKYDLESNSRKFYFKTSHSVKIETGKVTNNFFDSINVPEQMVTTYSDSFERFIGEVIKSKPGGSSYAIIEKIMQDPVNSIDESFAVLKEVCQKN